MTRLFPSPPRGEEGKERKFKSHDVESFLFMSSTFCEVNEMNCADNSKVKSSKRRISKPSTWLCSVCWFERRKSVEGNYLEGILRKKLPRKGFRPAELAANEKTFEHKGCLVTSKPSECNRECRGRNLLTCRNESFPLDLDEHKLTQTSRESLSAKFIKLPNELNLRSSTRIICMLH